ncbi:MAG TPA: iron ABC transporter permease, partial [Acidimicrobiia bacterium]
MTALDTVAPAPLPAPPRRGRFRARPPLALSVASLVVAAFFAAPLVYLVVRNTQAGADALDVLTSDTALGPLQRTLVLAATVALSTAVVGTAAAWLVSRTDLPARRLFRVLLALPLVIPSFVGALALVAAFAPGGLLEEFLGLEALPEVRGYWAAFVVLTLLTYPYVYLPVAARLAALPPALEETGRSLGRSPANVFRTVVLPQTAGAISAGALLVFLYVVSDFGAVAIVRYDTLTTRIEASRLFDPTTSASLALLLGVVAVAVVIAERGVSRRRVQTEAVAAGRGTFQAPLGRWKAPALGFVVLLVASALAAPVSVLGLWAWRGVRGDAARDRVDLAGIWQPAVNTAGIAVVTALVAIAIVLPVAYLTTRHRSRVGGVANAFVVGGFALPGLVIALAVVFWVLQAPLVGGLYQTFPLLVFAYVVHFGAQAMRSSQVAVGGVPRRLDDAARSLGAGRLRRLRTVDVPLMLPGLAAGAGLVLLSTMKELPATLLLAPIGFETLATRIWSATESAFFARAGAAALVLVALSGALTW